MEYDTNLSYRRIVYFDYNDVTAFEILDRRGDVIQTIPKGSIGTRDRVTVNIDTGQVTHGIPFGNYSMFSLQAGFWLWVLFAMIAVFLAYVIVLFIPAFALMLTCIFRKHPSGKKRFFSGSYPHLIICYLGSILIIGYMFLYQLAGMIDLSETSAQYADFVHLLLVLYIVGTVLYPFAHRSFSGKSMRIKRWNKMVDDIDRAETVKSWTEYTYSDGSTGSDYGEKLSNQRWGLVIFWIVKLFLAPFFVFFAIIKNYLFDRHPPNYQPAEKSQPAAAPAPTHVPNQAHVQAQAQVQAYAQTHAHTQAPASNQAQAGAPAPSGIPVPWDHVSNNAFAYWAPDGYYYPAIIRAKYVDVVDLQYADGQLRRVGHDELLSCKSALSLNLECNRGRQGYYYPCRICDVSDENDISVRYDIDGAVEVVDLDVMRLRR